MLSSLVCSWVVLLLPCLGHFTIGAALLAFWPPCSHYCCHAWLSPRSPPLAQLTKSCSGPTWSGSFPRSRLNACRSSHSHSASFYLCSRPSLVDCYAAFLRLPAPCSLPAASVSQLRPLLLCSRPRAVGQLVSPLTAWLVMSVHAAGTLLFAQRLSLQLHAACPLHAVFPALTSCRSRFSSAAHPWQLAACVSFHGHLHPYSQGARPFHLTVVFSAAPCQARPWLGHGLHAVGCRPILKLRQHGSEPYSLLADGRPTLVAGVSLLASAAFLAADGFERPVWVKFAHVPWLWCQSNLPYDFRRHPDFYRDLEHFWPSSTFISGPSPPSTWVGL